MSDAEVLAGEVLAGSARAVGRALSVVEAGGERARRLLRSLPAESDRVRVVGITGGFGSGKSTLVEALGVRLLERGSSVAVLAVDPSSPFTGGALLGDRVRMTNLAAAGGFVRSMATRGALGGLSAATAGALQVLGAAGYDRILVETVGVGQDEVDVAGEADTVVVLLPPGSGDEVQTAKAGLLEIADVLVINKADQPGADGVQSALEGMLAVAPPEGWEPPILRTVARTGEGVDGLLDAITAHESFLDASGQRRARRRARLRRRVERVLNGLIADGLRAVDRDAYSRAMEEAADGRREPHAAAEELFSLLRGRKGLKVIDHIGVAVRSLDERAGLYQALGLEIGGTEQVGGQGVRVAFLPVEGTRIELLEPTGDDSPIARFIARRGEGLHHLCFRVGDLSAAMKDLRARGFELLSDEPQPGAHGSRVCFVHPRSAGGVLVELAEE